MISLERGGYSREQVLAALQGRYGRREISFRFELLDASNRTVRGLDTVESASVSYDSEAEVKRTARLSMVDDGTVDFLTGRLRPVVRVGVPTLPTPGAVTAGTTYDEAVALGVRLLLARWRLDETAGTSAVDASGNGRSLTYGAATTKAGTPLIEDLGRSVTLSTAANGQLSTTDAAWLSGLTTLSFAGWLKPSVVGVPLTAVRTLSGNTWGDQAGKTWASLTPKTWAQVGGGTSWGQLATRTWGEVSNYSWGELSSGTVGGFRVQFTATRQVQVTVYTATASVTATTPPNSLGTDRVFLACTWTSGGTLAVYLNGERAMEVSSAAVAGPLRGVAGLNINFNGQLDDTLFAGTSLSSLTIRSLYQVGAAVGPAAPPGQAYVEFPLGVFLLSSPERAVNEHGVVRRQVEAYDQTVVLQSTKTDQPYYVAAGELYTTVISSILAGASGIPSYAVAASTKVVPAQLVWEPGTTFLRILTELITALNYEALHFDETGTAIVSPYVDPQTRPVEYQYQTDAVSVIRPGASQSLDLFDAPNKWVLSVSRPDRAALTASFTNTDPASPLSTVRRGRTIVDFRSEQEVVDLATLQAMVTQIAQESARRFEEVEFSTAIMPMHSHRDVYELAYPDLGVDGTYVETGWSYRLTPGEEMRHTAQRVVTLAGVLA